MSVIFTIHGRQRIHGDAENPELNITDKHQVSPYTQLQFSIFNLQFSIFIVANPCDALHFVISPTINVLHKVTDPIPYLPPLRFWTVLYRRRLWAFWSIVFPRSRGGKEGLRLRRKEKIL